MSASSDNTRPTSIYAFPRSEHEPLPEHRATSRTDSRPDPRIDSFILSIRKVDEALQYERARANQCEADLKYFRELHERLTRENNEKVHELSVHENKLRAALEEYRANSEQLKDRINSLQSQLKRAITELDQYRGAWTEILRRETDAKAALVEARSNSQRLADAETRARRGQGEYDQLLKQCHGYYAEAQRQAELSNRAKSEIATLNRTVELLQEQVERAKAGSNERHEAEVDRIRQELSQALETELERNIQLRAEINEVKQHATETSQELDAYRDAFHRIQDNPGNRD